MDNSYPENSNLDNLQPDDYYRPFPTRPFVTHTTDNNIHNTTFSNLSCPIPIQPLLHMVQYVADWVAPFSSPKIRPYSPFTCPLFSISLRAREIGAIIKQHCKNIIQRLLLHFYIMTFQKFHLSKWISINCFEYSYCGL